MAFFGVLGAKKEARARFEERASYLYAPALHFSIDGRVAICHDEGEGLEALAARSPLFFVATASKNHVAQSGERLIGFYRRYGRRLRRHITCPTAFALYDVRRGALLLGGTEGEKCYVEEAEGAIFFSSDPWLLRAPIPIDFGILK